MAVRIAVVLLSAFVVGTILPVDASEPDFNSYWHDGKAEMNGYRLTVSRYGKPRQGTCVMVYVTEPFSESKRVKTEDPRRNPGDTFDVLKLNLIRDFQTGIYDYNTMVSLFVRSEDFSPVKISFTSAEWCGHVYEELLFYPGEITGHYYSYFEDESEPRNVENIEGGIVEDNLFIVLRGLRGDFLEPGDEITVRMLPSVYFGRLSHKPPSWEDTEIRRLPATKNMDVPAGTFETIVYEIEFSGGRTGTFFIDSEYPHQIIRWEMLPDIKGELSGSKRLEYWKLNDVGDEKYLGDLGLE